MRISIKHSFGLGVFGERKSAKRHCKKCHFAFRAGQPVHFPDVTATCWPSKTSYGLSPEECLIWVAKLFAAWSENEIAFIRWLQT